MLKKMLFIWKNSIHKYLRYRARNVVTYWISEEIRLQKKAKLTVIYRCVHHLHKLHLLLLHLLPAFPFVSAFYTPGRLLWLLFMPFLYFFCPHLWQICMWKIRGESDIKNFDKAFHSIIKGYFGQSNSSPYSLSTIGTGFLGKFSIFFG